jgi:hypothetical protein
MADAVPFDVAAKVKSYLLGIFEDFPDVLFQEDRTATLSPQGCSREGRATATSDS